MYTITNINLDLATSKILKTTIDYGFKEFCLKDDENSQIAFIQTSSNNFNLALSYRKKFSHKALIVVSKHEIACDKRFIYTTLPLSPGKISSALNEAKTYLNTLTLTNYSGQVNVKQLALKNKVIAHDKKRNNFRSSLDGEESSSRRSSYFIGARKDIDLTKATSVKKIQYDPAIYIQGQLCNMIAEAQKFKKISCLKTSRGVICYLPAKNKIKSNTKYKTFRALARIPNPVNHKMVLISPADFNIYCKGIEVFSENADVILWNSALLASRGRLPLGTDLDKPLHLRHWPNLTKLTLVAHTLKIIALWHQQPISIRDTIKVLNIPQRYVFLTYSAAKALNLFEGIGLENKRKHTPNQNSINLIQKTHQKKYKGLIGQLLKHLKPRTPK